MLRFALSLISSLQVGAQIKDTVERSARRAALAVVAVVILLFAIGFGLVTGYFALLDQGLAPMAASGIIAGALAVLSAILFVIATHKPRPKQPDIVNAPAETIALVDKSVGKAMQQVGPLTLLTVAFAVGLLASRRR